MGVVDGAENGDGNVDNGHEKHDVRAGGKISSARKEREPGFGVKESNTLTRTGGVYLRVGGEWKQGTVYRKVSGSWKQAAEVYRQVNGTWRRSVP